MQSHLDMGTEGNTVRLLIKNNYIRNPLILFREIKSGLGGRRKPRVPGDSAGGVKTGAQAQFLAVDCFSS